MAQIEEFHASDYRKKRNLYQFRREKDSGTTENIVFWILMLSNIRTCHVFLVKQRGQMLLKFTQNNLGGRCCGNKWQ
jgi:hypothetical protein